MRKLRLLILIITTMTMLSCSNKTSEQDNPLLTEWDTPFGMPPFNILKAEHFKPAYIEGMQQQYSEIDSIINNPAPADFKNVIVALDNSGGLFNNVSRIFSIMNSGNTNDELTAVQIEMSPILSAHYDNIFLNERLFAKVSEVYDNRESAGLDSLQLRLLEKKYRSFVRSGANLSGSDKEKLMEINSELSRLQVEFGNNLLAATQNFVMVVDSADVTGLPKSIMDAASEKAKQIGENKRFAFTLSKTSLIPFITYSDREDLRERLYTGYLNRCNYGDSTDNRQIVNDIVRLRTEKANLLGYGNHTEYVLEDRMAKTPAEVYSLLDALWGPALESAKLELEEMREIKLRETGSDEFHSWDWWYYAEKVRREKYDLDEEALRNYFAIGNVQAGIFDLSNRLFGVTFRPVNIPKYHSECLTFEVLDINNNHLGVLLMDLYQRDGKRVGAWCSSYQGRAYDENGTRVSEPIVTIVCNFTRPSGNKPALLNLDEVETFFHEFGHALHALFTDVPYRGLQGTERDFVELPSQIMENWALEPAMLRRYALHYQNKSVIPDNLIEKIQNSALFNQGFMTTELLAASYSDMDIHTMSEYTPLDINSFEVEILNLDRGLIEQIAPRYRLPYFNHIFNGGYSSGYYSYIWAEVLDKDAYQAFVETGDIFNKRVAEKFRKEILEKGGSADGMTLYRNFRGHDPAREYLLYSRGLLVRPPTPVDFDPESMWDDTADIEDGEISAPDAAAGEE